MTRSGQAEDRESGRNDHCPHHITPVIKPRIRSNTNTNTHKHTRVQQSVLVRVNTQHQTPNDQRPTPNTQHQYQLTTNQSQQQKREPTTNHQWSESSLTQIRSTSLTTDRYRSWAVPFMLIALQEPLIHPRLWAFSSLEFLEE